MAYVHRGNRAENLVAAHGLDQGWLPSSRRHMKGAGDQLWVKPNRRSRLIEVKSGPNLWQCFRKADRVELIATAEKFDLDPLLAHVPNPGAQEPQIIFLTQDQFPSPR